MTGTIEDVTRLVIPPPFAARAPRVLGPESVPWLAALPDLADRFARAWNLVFEGPALQGFVGVVQPARRADGTPVVLKLGWPHEESRDDSLALSTWAGRGAVLLLEAAPDEGVQQLERRVNEDLHYENVLAGQREPWLVIDPKPIAGDLEYGVFSLLWNRFDESTVDQS
ncbi:aminoglycoside phosphotransferase family protein [Amycolatopsis sp. NPDC004368]